MAHLYYNNVNDAFRGIVEGFNSGAFMSRFKPHGNKILLHPDITHSPSRYGEVITIEEPVTITYHKPLQRVLWNPNRDANPFFHLIEAMWMLAGRNDIEPLVHFNPRMKEFSDNGRTLHDAYGHRWRNWPLANDFIFDQLPNVIQQLRKDPHSRRVVLQMWSVDDLRKGVVEPNCKSLPCNLCVMFRARHVTTPIPKRGSQKPTPTTTGLLDMTVINRSNDTLWGALGANYVHFSFLQEYIALAVGMEVGNYHQISNNLHIYTHGNLNDDMGDSNVLWSNKWSPASLLANHLDCYDSTYQHFPLYNDREAFDTQVKLFFRAKWWQAHDWTALNSYTMHEYGEEVVNNPFLLQCIFPAVFAFNAYKRRDFKAATRLAAEITPSDWRLACLDWIKRRQARWESRDSGAQHAV